MTRALASLLVAAALAGMVVLVAREPASPGYPRAFSYSHLRSTGAPFVTGNVVDTAAVKFQARFDQTIIDPARVGIGADVLRLMRSSNKRATMLAFHKAGKFFVCSVGWYGQTPPVYGCDTTGQNAAWSRWKVIRKHDAVVLGVRGGMYAGNGGGWLDFGRPGFAAEYADTIVAWSGQPFGGAFLDETCLTTWWARTATDTADYRRHGYATYAEWDRDYRAGMLAFYDRMDARLGLVVGNCGPTGALAANGWMGENLPYQPPASWDGWHAVLDRADTAYAPPQMSFITAMREGLPWASLECQRRVRFILGTASLHDAVSGALVGSGFDPLRGFQPDYWPDELCVTAKGNASVDMRRKGWLGQPKGPAILGGIWRRDFDHGVVLVNPSRAPVTLEPGANLYRIRGKACPSVNTGEPVWAITVPANDGIFLQRR